MGKRKITKKDAMALSKALEVGPMPIPPGLEGGGVLQVESWESIESELEKTFNDIRGCKVCHKRKRDVLTPFCHKCERIGNTEMGKILYE